MCWKTGGSPRGAPTKTLMREAGLYRRLVEEQASLEQIGERGCGVRKRFAYSIPAMTRRLLHIAAPIKGTLLVSTLASIIGIFPKWG